MKTHIIILMVYLSISITLNSQTLEDKWVVCNSQGCEILDPYYSEGETFKWEGSCINGKADGFGRLTKFKNGEHESTYEGEFKNGIREGKGKFIHADKTVREGIFINGQMTGKGTMVAEDGQKYIGDFINYRMHGNGIVYFPSGARFEGFFVSDNFYTGKLTNHDGKVIFIEKGKNVSSINEKTSGYKPEIGIRLTEYFDENWNRCKQKEAAYYRLITYEAPNKPKGLVKDYYISGQIQSEFYAVYLDYDDEGKNFHEGEATWYFQNGKIEQKRFYYNNKINGKNTFYYDNGEKVQEANFVHGILDGEFKQWHKTGKLKAIAIYKNGELLNNKFTEYDENGFGSLVYMEDFNKNNQTWTTKEYSSESYINQKNQVEFILKEDFPANIGTYIQFNQTSDFSIETVIQKKSGNDYGGYGIFFGLKDAENFFQFIITGTGKYKISGIFEGINLLIKDWTESDYINKSNDQNSLKILKLNDRFVFSINGNIVEDAEYQILRGNYFGILAALKGEYVLESLTIKEFVTKGEIASNVTPNEEDDTQDWKGNGSGFFISEKGYIATNYHVIEDAKDIQIEYFQKGLKQSFKAKIIVSDKQNDLAILKIDDDKYKILPRIPYVFNTVIKDVGTEVFALGYPIASVMGEEVKFTDGKISAKTGLQGDVRVYQISTPIQPGNSGGPLFDTKGNLVGITSAALNKEYFNSENVNYAIKCTYLKNLIDVLPEAISIPNDTEIYNKTLTEKIKILSDFIPIIKVR